MQLGIDCFLGCIISGNVAEVNQGQSHRVSKQVCACHTSCKK